MKRAFPHPEPSLGLQQFQKMQEEALGLKLLLPYLPEGATMDDARALQERLTQLDRKPCSFLDGPLGIKRG